MFVKLLIERSIRAALAAALATVAVGVGTATNWQSVRTLAVAAFAAGVSAAISLVSQLVGDVDSTSFIK